MGVARKDIVDSDNPGLYHCVSRCVRRAFLCGEPYEHRRLWIRALLEELAGIFAMDVVAFAILSNHLHVIVWTDPERAKGWSRMEVATRWLRLHPKSCPEGLTVEQAARQFALDAERIEVLRRRLASLSWFMRCLKQPVARRANKEDDCTGHFWESRFKSFRIADDAGGLTCCIYVDLNVVHAGLAAIPEESRHTSVWERIQVRQAYERQERELGRGREGEREQEDAHEDVDGIEEEIGHQVERTGVHDHDRHNQAARSDTPAARRRAERRQRRRLRHAEDGLWLTPMGGHDPPQRPTAETRKTRGVETKRTIFGIGVDRYLELVDSVGRIVRNDKRGSIPQHLRPILERLGLEIEDWLDALMRDVRDLWGSTIGLARSLVHEAQRRGRLWVVNPFGPLG